MENSLLATFQNLKGWQRLLVAFLIGAPTTMIYGFVSFKNPIWWQPTIPAFVYLTVLILAVASHPKVQSGDIADKSLRTILLSVVLLVLVFFVVEFVLLQLFILTQIIAWILTPFVVGLIAAFAIGHHRKKGYAQWIGFVTWLGAATINMIATYYDYILFQQTEAYRQLIKTIPVGDGAAIVLMTLLAHFSGLALAAFGGEFGWKLHRKFFGASELELAEKKVEGQVVSKS